MYLKPISGCYLGYFAWLLTFEMLQGHEVVWLLFSFLCISNPATRIASHLERSWVSLLHANYLCYHWTIVFVFPTCHLIGRQVWFRPHFVWAMPSSKLHPMTYMHTYVCRYMCVHANMSRLAITIAKCCLILYIRNMFLLRTVLLNFNRSAQMVFVISQLKRFRYYDTDMPLNKVREIAWLDFVKDLK